MNNFSILTKLLPKMQLWKMRSHWIQWYISYFDRATLFRVLCNPNYHVLSEFRYPPCAFCYVIILIRSFISRFDWSVLLKSHISERCVSFGQSDINSGALRLEVSLQFEIIIVCYIVWTWRLAWRISYFLFINNLINTQMGRNSLRVIALLAIAVQMGKWHIAFLLSPYLCIAT